MIVIQDSPDLLLCRVSLSALLHLSWSINIFISPSVRICLNYHQSTKLLRSVTTMICDLNINSICLKSTEF